VILIHYAVETASIIVIKNLWIRVGQIDNNKKKKVKTLVGPLFRKRISFYVTNRDILAYDRHHSFYHNCIGKTKYEGTKLNNLSKLEACTRVEKKEKDGKCKNETKVKMNLSREEAVRSSHSKLGLGLQNPLEKLLLFLDCRYHHRNGRKQVDFSSTTTTSAATFFQNLHPPLVLLRHQNSNVRHPSMCVAEMKRFCFVVCFLFCVFSSHL